MPQPRARSTGRRPGTGTPPPRSVRRGSSRCRKGGRWRSGWGTATRCRREEQRARDAAVSIERITHLVGGTPWTGVAERTSKVYNPATGEVTGELDLASAATVDEVV